MVEITNICFNVIANWSLTKLCEKKVPVITNRLLKKRRVIKKSMERIPRIGFLVVGRKMSKKKIINIARHIPNSKMNRFNISNPEGIFT